MQRDWIHVNGCRNSSAGRFRRGLDLGRVRFMVRDGMVVMAVTLIRFDFIPMSVVSVRMGDMVCGDVKRRENEHGSGIDADR